MARKKKREEVQEAQTAQQVQIEQQERPSPDDSIIPGYQQTADTQQQEVVNDAAETSGTHVERESARDRKADKETLFSIPLDDNMRLEAVSKLSDALTGAIVSGTRGEKAVIDGRKLKTVLTSFMNSPGYKAIENFVRQTNAFLTAHAEQIREFTERFEVEKGLSEALAIELEARQNDPAFAELTLDELLKKGLDENGEPNDTIFGECLESALILQDRLDSDRTFVASTKTIYGGIIDNLPSELKVTTQPTETAIYPLSKVVGRLFDEINYTQATCIDGQYRFIIPTSSRETPENIKAYIWASIQSIQNINGEMKKIMSQLSPVDVRTYITCAALWYAGNHITTATQIAKLMGNNKPSPRQIQRINDILTKFTARIYLTNKPYYENGELISEGDVKEGYPEFVADEDLLYFRRVRAEINGVVTDAAIQILAEPVIMRFVRQRKQMTTVNLSWLNPPLSLTDDNVRLEDYLLERIARQKHELSKGDTFRILNKTLFDNCRIVSRMQKTRAAGKIKTIMDHYKKHDYISDYKLQPDAIEVTI